MSRSQRLNGTLDRAKGKEKKYGWLEAAELYEQALRAVGKEDFLEKGEIQERIGYCFYRRAFQAESQEEFKRRMGLSVKAYEEATELFEGLEDSKKPAQISLCRARAAYSKSWLAENPAERKALLDECRALSKNAAKAYEETGDHVGQGQACNELLACLQDRSLLAQDAQELNDIVEEALVYGEQAVHALAATGDDYALTRAYYQLSWGYVWAGDACESIEKQNSLKQQALSYAEKAVEAAERTRDKYLLSMSNLTLESARYALHVGTESSLEHLEKILQLATVTRDTFLIANVRETQAWRRRFFAGAVEDLDKRREENNKAIQAAEDAIARLELLSYPFIRAYYYYSSSYLHLALDETDLERKRGLLMKAAELAGKFLPKAQRSGSPLTALLTLHSLSASLGELATIETETGERRRLSAQAAEYRAAAIDTLDRVHPFSYWDRGMVRVRLAGLKAELAKMETDREKKKDLLTAAAVTGEEAVHLVKKSLKAIGESPAVYSHVASAQDLFRGALNQLYLLTGEKTYLEQAIKICEDAVEAWGKVGRQSRIAEAHWQMAKFYDQLGKHIKAAQAFAAASKGYALVAEMFAQLKTFYTDHKVYMEAWSEIEKARHAHAVKEYGQANDHYRKAAALHEKTKRWRYLSPNYAALALLNKAEDLSREEQTEEAKELFEQAAKRFDKAKESIEAKLETIKAHDEKEAVTQLAKAPDIRREYCLARTALEEAKILDKQGDHVASAKRYGVAAEIFQKAADSMESESDRKELKPIICLSRAWHKMKRAEAEASPELYLEASRLFDEAKEHSLDEKAKLLALGHSSFCKALEAGTRFEAVRDTSLHALATQHLEGAASYYLRAGFKNASEYAEATQKLLDAYLYMHNAKTETDPTKKTRLYMITEKVLQAAAGSYLKAKHPEKQEQVSRFLEKVRKERELALSLTEVLHAPLATATTATFTTPTSTKETPIGLERFEHADIQANLLLRVKQANVDEDMEFRMELVNAGKAPALLIKVDEITPEGFEIKEVPEICVVEDSYLNLKGRRLNPLKTLDIKMTIKPRSKGTFSIKPRVLYIDETGKYKSHDPEPVTITVKELGIRDWIKGET